MHSVIIAVTIICLLLELLILQSLRLAYDSSSSVLYLCNNPTNVHPLDCKILNAVLLPEILIVTSTTTVLFSWHITTIMFFDESECMPVHQ